MNSSKNLSSTLLKAICLATILFWVLISSENFDKENIPFIFLSIIPISIVSSLTIIITIFPFYFFKKTSMSNNKIFKKYFPYYSIIVFGISTYFIFYINVEYLVNIFFITAFITLMQSWVWISKPNSTIQNTEKTNL